MLFLLLISFGWATVFNEIFCNSEFGKIFLADYCVYETLVNHDIFLEISNSVQSRIKDSKKRKQLNFDV